MTQPVSTSSIHVYLVTVGVVQRILSTEQLRELPEWGGREEGIVCPTLTPTKIRK
jgi:hypothetical protein